MGFDLYAVQVAIDAHLTTTFPSYVFHRNTVPEDEQVPRTGEEVNPFFVMQFGPLTTRRNGRQAYLSLRRSGDYLTWRVKPLKTT